MSVLASSGLLILILLCVIGVEVLIGVMVYRDAKARGMEPWLWAAVCVLVPYFIGLIVIWWCEPETRVACSAATAAPLWKKAYACCPVRRGAKIHL